MPHAAPRAASTPARTHARRSAEQLASYLVVSVSSRGPTSRDGAVPAPVACTERSRSRRRSPSRYLLERRRLEPVLLETRTLCPPGNQTSLTVRRAEIC